MSALAVAKQTKKSLLHRVRDYQCSVRIIFESDSYLIKTAENGSELLKTLELRHEIFIKEWQGRKSINGLDVDDFDFLADHLMIIDKRSNSVIGTYRLISSRRSQKFYSADEFELSQFLAMAGTKLEMGRACIHPEHRNGNSIDLLWKGLSRYVFATRADYLFGCSSVKVTDPELVGKLYKFLRADGAWSDEFNVRPNAKYSLFSFDLEGHGELSHSEKRLMMPPLLRSYVHAGAKIYGHPALDVEFSCVDVFTILDWKNLNAKFKSRFNADKMALISS